MVRPRPGDAYIKLTRKHIQMQNRLNAVKDTHASLRSQLDELRTAVEAEQAARPESVSRAAHAGGHVHHSHVRYRKTALRCSSNSVR